MHLSSTCLTPDMLSTVCVCFFNVQVMLLVWHAMVHADTDLSVLARQSYCTRSDITCTLCTVLMHTAGGHSR